MRADLRYLIAFILVLTLSNAPAFAARQIVDLHRLDAYFALFASDSNVPWQPATVRLDTYSGAPVDFAVYQVDPGDVLTAGSNARPRAILTRGRKPVASWRFTPPGAYQFESSEVHVPLGNREGFFVVEARRGDVGEQVWINRTRIALVTKEEPGAIVLYGTDTGTGRALAGMRVQFLVGTHFDTHETDAHGVIKYDRSPRPVFALAQWADSFAFVSFLPQAPVPSGVVGVRTDTAVVAAGDAMRVAGFVRTRSGNYMEPGRGNVTVTVRNGAFNAGEQSVALDAAGAFTAQIPLASNAPPGDYAVIAQSSEGVGSASVRVEANANGLSLRAASACETTCDDNAPVPVRITASRGGVAVHVRVVRSPHVFAPGYIAQTTPWGTSVWYERTVTTDASGVATVEIPRPTDRLSSTYGVHVDAEGATADTRIVVPTSRAALRLHLDREQQTLGTPVRFDVYASDIASGAPIANTQVTVQMRHGVSADQQTVTLDASGHGRGSFSSPQFGTSILMATLNYEGAQAADAGEVQLVSQATNEADENGSGAVHISLDRDFYHVADTVHVDASLDRAQGEALLTWESASGAQTVVAPVRAGHATADFKVGDAVGDVRVGAAFVRDGAVEFSTTPLSIDAPGRGQEMPMDVSTEGGNAKISMRGAAAGPGTVFVRITRGAPSGAASFVSAPSLLQLALASTQTSAPSGRTWHPWVNSTGDHPQVLGFIRKTTQPADLTISDASTESVSWQMLRDSADPIVVQLPAQRGRYTVSVFKMYDDGRVIAGASSMVVP